MARGVIYIMTTVVDGLIKIGKTETKQFKTRMQHLEGNGYKNITGLKRCFAIEVDDYDEKETLLHSVFDRSRVPGTELFALDVRLATQLLSALEGKQIYPEPESQSKKEVFEEVTEGIKESKAPNGKYYFNRKINNKTTISGSMIIEDGKFIIQPGSDFYPETKNLSGPMTERRKNADVKNGKLQKEEVFYSSSLAAMFLIGAVCNGPRYWKTKDNIALKDLLPAEENEENSII